MKKITLQPGERLDDLQYKGLFIIQKPGVCTFTADSVLLAAFATCRSTDRVIDLGAGNGIIAMLCSARTGAGFTCLEREEPACDLAVRSIGYNDLDISVYCADWADAPAMLGYNTFSCAICNPPYFSPEAAVSPEPLRAAARSTDQRNLSSLFQSAYSLLKGNGKLFLCYPAGQLVDLLCWLREEKLEPKRIRMVYPKPGKPPYLALVEARKDGRPYCIWEPPLYQRDKDGQPTEEINAIYHIRRRTE